MPGLFGYLNQTTGGDVTFHWPEGDSSAILLNVINKPEFHHGSHPEF